MQRSTLTHFKVSFEGVSGYRRKASLAPPPSFGSMPTRPQHSRQTTACMVHELLEKHNGKPLEEHSASNEGIASERQMDKDPHSQARQMHQSRLLTKNQISQMALGIRELSKKLSQIRLKLNVRNVFILGKAHDETLIKYTREVAEWALARDANHNVYVYPGDAGKGRRA